MAEKPLAERTEQPTARRRTDAHAEGRVPRSPELTTAALLLAFAAVVKLLGPGLSGVLAASLASSLVLAGAGPLDAQGAVALVQGLGWKIMAALGSLLLAVAATVITVGAVQARGVLSLRPITPDWGRVDPLANLQRLLGAEAWAGLARSLLKLAIVGMVVWLSLDDTWSAQMVLAHESPRGLATVIRDQSVRVFLNAGLAYLALALADYAYQTWRHERELRMTRDEVRQEQKQADGDPQLRSQRRTMGRALLARQLPDAVAQASVVVVDPDRIAVALRYDPQSDEAPVVMAVGRQRLAARIEGLARAEGIPVVKDAALAGALVAGARAGAAIAPELYVPVAEVLAGALRSRETAGAGSAGA